MTSGEVLEGIFGGEPCRQLAAGFLAIERIIARLKNRVASPHTAAISLLNN